MKVNCQLSLTRILHTRTENHLLKQQPRQFVFTDHLSVQILHYLCTAIRTKKRNRKRSSTRCDVDDNSFFSEIERKCAYHTSERESQLWSSLFMCSSFYSLLMTISPQSHVRKVLLLPKWTLPNRPLQLSWLERCTGIAGTQVRLLSQRAYSLIFCNCFLFSLKMRINMHSKHPSRTK